MTDPYQVLGISPSATDDEVKAAYRKMAKLYHPDRNNGSEEAEKKMMQVNEAYAQIMDMRKNGGAHPPPISKAPGRRDIIIPSRALAGSAISRAMARRRARRSFPPCVNI